MDRQRTTFITANIPFFLWPSAQVSILMSKKVGSFNNVVNSQLDEVACYSNYSHSISGALYLISMFSPGPSSC